MKNTNEMDKTTQTTAYDRLLQDQRWFQKRAQILERDHKRCRVCHEDSHCIVHHRQYHFDRAAQHFVKPWEYKEKYLITLCEACHQKGHQQFKVPVKYI